MYNKLTYTEVRLYFAVTENCAMRSMIYISCILNFFWVLDVINHETIQISFKSISCVRHQKRMPLTNCLVVLSPSHQAATCQQISMAVLLLQGCVTHVYMQWLILCHGRCLNLLTLTPLIYCIHLFFTSDWKPFRFLSDLFSLSTCRIILCLRSWCIPSNCLTIFCHLIPAKSLSRVSLVIIVFITCNFEHL